MTVASPVLERKIIAEEEREYADTFVSAMSAEELHNAKIRANYKRLINPESTPDDIITREVQPAKAQTVIPARNEQVAEPYLVRNARADSDIFRADSIINRKEEAVSQPVVMSENDEEENEDLRPTQTTIQYKTVGLKRAEEEGKIETASTTKRAISKRDRIIIAAVVSVVVALFVLIIINSAIISNLNGELSYLQSSLTSAKAAYSSISDEISEYMANLYQTAKDYAMNGGFIG